MGRRRVLAVLLLVIGAAMVVWHWPLAPQIQPTPLTPAQQAVEDELAAWRKAGMVVEMDAFWQPPIADDENAASLILQAIEAMGSRGSWSEETRHFLESPILFEARGPWDAAGVTAAESVVTHFATTLSLLRQAAARPQCRYPRNPSGAGWDMEHVKGHMHAMWLLQLASRLALERGERDQAVARCHEVLQLYRGLARSPDVQSQIAAAGAVGRALELVSLLASRDALSPEAARQLADAIPSRDDLTVSLRRAINGDALHLHANRIQALRSAAARPADAMPVADVVFLLRHYRHEWQRAVHPAYVRATLPPLPEPPENSILQGFGSLYPDLPALYRDEAVVWAELARTVLAVESQREDKHAYHTLLAALMSGDWRHVASDPFTGKPYRCERVGSGYRLWSTGRDGRDDGGNETDDLVVEVRAGQPAAAESAAPCEPLPGRSASPKKTSTSGTEWREYWRKKMMERSEPPPGP